MTEEPRARAADTALLDERARRLAAPAARPEAEHPMQVLEFSVAEERYGFEAREIDDVQPLRDLTPLPGERAFWRGLVNVRGRIVPVIDLRRFFGLPERGISDLHRILMLRRDDLEVGLLVDAVDGVASIDAATLQASLPAMGEIDGAFIKGITADRRVILDAQAILADPRILLDEEVS